MKKRKRFLLIFILLILIIALISLIIIKKRSDYTKISKDTQKTTSFQIELPDKKIDNLIFTNIECSGDQYLSTLYYSITNQSQEVINLEEYEIIIKNSANQTITTLTLNLNYNLSPNETINTSDSTNIILNEIADIEFKKEGEPNEKSK